MLGLRLSLSIVYCDQCLNLACDVQMQIVAAERTYVSKDTSELSHLRSWVAPVWPLPMRSNRYWTARLTMPSSASPAHTHGESR